MKFKDLAIGSRFKWQSNLGAGDLMQKVSEDEIFNLHTRNRKHLTESIFTAEDPVKIKEEE